MNKKLIISFALTTLLALPVLVFAAPPAGVPILGIGGIANALSSIENFVFAIFLALAVIMFIVAGYYFLISDVTKGRSAVIYGTIGVGVAILSYSIVFIVTSLLQGNGN